MNEKQERKGRLILTMQTDPTGRKGNAERDEVCDARNKAEEQEQLRWISRSRMSECLQIFKRPLTSECWIFVFIRKQITWNFYWLMGTNIVRCFNLSLCISATSDIPLWSWDSYWCKRMGVRRLCTNVFACRVTMFGVAPTFPNVVLAC